MFEFSLPWLWLLAPAPFLVYWLAPKHQRQSAALIAPFFNTVAGLSGHTQVARTQSVLLRILAVCIWLLVLASAARPQWVGDPVHLPASGRDLMLAVDISGSMDATDMVINGRQHMRIDVVKFVVGDFVERRESDRLGLILFGSQAYLQAPLTFDRVTVNTLLNEAQLGFAGPQTAIGDALGLAIKRLQNRPETSRVLILLTDGANTAGQLAPRQAAELAKTAGVKIYTVGVGADEMIQEGFFGARRVNPSQDLDEETLKYIANQTGGQYFRARNPKELIEIYNELDQLEPIEQDAQTYRPIASLFYWPLALALLLSLALAGMNQSRVAST